MNFLTGEASFVGWKGDFARDRSADFKTMLTTIRSAGAFSSKCWRKTGALDGAGDEVVGDDLDGAASVLLALVQTLVRLPWLLQRDDFNFVQRI